jgi:hypothetical protein
VQWHRHDNTGCVEIIRLQDSKVQAEPVPGTQTSLPGGSYNRSNQTAENHVETAHR